MPTHGGAGVALQSSRETLPQNRREDVGPFHRCAQEPKLRLRHLAWRTE